MLCILYNFYSNIMSKYLPQVLASPHGGAARLGEGSPVCLTEGGQERRPEGGRVSPAGPPGVKPSEVSAS